jgi:hypothetical protein
VQGVGGSNPPSPIFFSLQGKELNKSPKLARRFFATRGQGTRIGRKLPPKEVNGMAKKQFYLVKRKDKLTSGKANFYCRFQ